MSSLEHNAALSLRESLLVPATTGLIVHLVYNRLEITPEHAAATMTLLAVAPLASSLFLLLHYSLEGAVLSGFATFYGALFSSIFLYRVSPWHPLAKYPGPFLAKVSQFWLVRKTMMGKWHETLKGLHEQYGPYVRVGPNELSFVDTSLVAKILGPNGMPKGPIFDGARVPNAPGNIVSTRSVSDHAELRKPWAKGLSSSAVKDYYPIIVRRVTQLTEALDNFASDKGEGERREVVDLEAWFSRYAFDFMGDMLFGGAFELMKHGDTSGMWTLVKGHMEGMALLERIPWAVHIAHKLPFVVTAMAKFHNFVDSCISQRFVRGPRGRDLFYHIAGEEKVPANGLPQGRGRAVLIENCKVAVIAGSDTTATTLSNLFFYLLTNPGVQRRLRKELDEAFPPQDGNPFDFMKLSELPVLNAVINETLRLHPPLTTDLQRAPSVGSGPKQIGDHILPEGTSVNVSPYVLHRQARYFSPYPEKFWIDRWLQTPGDSKSHHKNIVHDTTAYIPFSYGPANCVGKALALSQLRAGTACLLQRFEISFADGYDSSRWEKDMCNYFVLLLGQLPVVLTRRS